MSAAAWAVKVGGVTERVFADRVKAKRFAKELRQSGRKHVTIHKHARGKVTVVNILLGVLVLLFVGLSPKGRA
jgi:hypothetical protein